jgi:hypothetical protein
MQDPLYDVTYARLSAYWKDEITQWLPQNSDNRSLAIAACALSDDMTLPAILLRYMVAAIIRENDPHSLDITEAHNQSEQLKFKLMVSSDHFINLGRILDNFADIELKLLTQGWSFSDRRQIELTIPRKDLIKVIKKKMASDVNWLTRLHTDLLAQNHTFLVPGNPAPAPRGIGPSK